MEKREKTDATLGMQVHEHLLSLGIETPLNQEFKEANIQAAKTTAENGIFNMMYHMGLDMTDDSLIDTPKRFADMMVDEMFSGLNYNNFPKVVAVENKMGADEMVMVGPCVTMSLCEHHLVTIDAQTWVSYIPGNKVLGLSKISRIVNFFARRPQIQERLVEQIAATIQFLTGAEDIAVVIKGVHYCMKSRGIRDLTAETVTSKMGGRFRSESSLRQEFLSCVK
ncbi:MAG: GTP cyclohydrolase I FolE [Waterburya sp.]